MTEQAQIIRWQNPPPPAPRGRLGGRKSSDSPRNLAGNPGVRYTAMAAELRTRPGEYAVIQEGVVASGLGSAVSLGRLHTFRPAGDYEGTARRRNGLVTVYARYLGDGESGHA